MKNRVRALLTVMFILCGALWTAKRTDASVPYPQLDPKFGTPIQLQNADLTGDGSEDIAALFGDKQSPSSPYYERLTLVVQDADVQHVTIIPLQQGGYNPTMKIYDFNGDGVVDVLVGTETGGSAGASDYTIHTVKGGHPMAMAVPQPLKAQSTFKDGYKVEIKIPETGRAHKLDVSDRKAEYDKAGIYKNGKLQKPTQASVNDFGKLEPIRAGNEGAYSLVGLQRVSGIYNADTIGYIASIWKWNPSMNKWSLLYTSVDPVVK